MSIAMFMILLFTILYEVTIYVLTWILDKLFETKM